MFTIILGMFLRKSYKDECGRRRLKKLVDNGCDFFVWYDDPHVCQRTNDIVSGLLNCIR